MWCEDGNAIAHERLAIIDPESGAQPFVDAEGQVTCAVNGEIYNHAKVSATMFSGYPFQTKSDCEVIVPLYKKFGPVGTVCEQLDGIFAFVLYDREKDLYFAGRDAVGVCPLYIGWGRDGSVCFASELKALQGRCERFEVFKPGHFFVSSGVHAAEQVRWYKPQWLMSKALPTKKLDFKLLRESLEASVVKRMMSDVPWGVLLSGGLDSSLVASIATRYAATAGSSSWPKLHSFCIGLDGSPDLAAAKQVADALGTAHHSYTFTVEDGIDALSDVIYKLETFDTTTIRAATPMYLMSRKIKAMGVKMVLSGEGADEILGGYLYFHKAPNAEELHAETVRKTEELYNYDVLRANKATSAWGLEVRVPFLDKDFLDTAMGFDPNEKMCTGSRIEKWCLRQAFDTPEIPYLPQNVLWRQKEQFSDGVGYSWIDSLREHAASEVSDAQMANAKHRFPYATPPTKESYFYRDIFEKHFPSASARETVPATFASSVACSTSKALEWDKSFQQLQEGGVGGECSGRSINVHAAAYTDVLSEVRGPSSAAAPSSSEKAKRHKAK